MLLTSTTHTPHPPDTPRRILSLAATRLSVFMGTIRCLVNRLETQSAIDFCLTPCFEGNSEALLLADVRLLAPLAAARPPALIGGTNTAQEILIRVFCNRAIPIAVQF